jgi:hypothetical protein
MSTKININAKKYDDITKCRAIALKQPLGNGFNDLVRFRV